MKHFAFSAVLKKTHAIPFLAGFIVFYIIGSVLLWIFDPDLNSLADSFWLAFNISTSIGLGDYTVSQPLARLTAAVLGFYGAIIVAFIPSLVASYYLEKLKTVSQRVFDNFEQEIGRIHEMSPEEKKELSSQIQKFHSNKNPRTTGSGSSSFLKSWELFALIFRQTSLARYLIGFIVVYLLCCWGVLILDPSIHSFADALWFGFMIVTTIGFGDFTVVHWSSRLLTMILGVYGIFMVDFICGVIASYFFDVIRAGKDLSITQMLHQLENLDTLSSQQIETLQKQIQQKSSFSHPTLK